MDLRSERDRASLTEQMSRLEKNIRGRDVKRQQGRERRKRANSDDDEEDDPEARMRREKRGREHGFLNLGAGALADAVAPAFTWHCDLCQITLSSEGLKHQHLHGAAHLKVRTRVWVGRLLCSLPPMRRCLDANPTRFSPRGDGHARCCQFHCPPVDVSEWMTEATAGLAFRRRRRRRRKTRRGAGTRRKPTRPWPWLHGPPTRCAIPGACRRCAALRVCPLTCVGVAGLPSSKRWSRWRRGACGRW